MKNKLLPQYLYENLHLVSDRNNYSLRNSNDLDISFARTLQLKNSVFSNGLSQFNLLPADVKRCRDVKNFKICLLKYMHNK